MSYSTGQSLVVLDLFGPKVVFACSSIHMIVQQQLTLRFRKEVHRIHEWPLLKSMAFVQCAPQKILEKSVIYIITMVKYCCSGNMIHQSHMNALETQNRSVCGLSLHPPTSWNGKQHWDATEVLQEATLKYSSSTCLFRLYSGWVLCPFLGIPFYKSTSSSHPWHCNKVVFSVEQKSVDSWGRFPVCRAGGRPWLTGSCPPPGLRSRCQCRPSCQCPQWSRPLSWWR